MFLSLISSQPKDVFSSFDFGVMSGKTLILVDAYKGENFTICFLDVCVASDGIAVLIWGGASVGAVGGKMW